MYQNKSIIVFVPLRIMSCVISRVVCARDNDDKKRIRERETEMYLFFS